MSDKLMNETSERILEYLNTQNKKFSINDLSLNLKISKALINKSLNLIKDSITIKQYNKLIIIQNKQEFNKNNEMFYIEEIPKLSIKLKELTTKYKNNLKLLENSILTFLSLFPSATELDTALGNAHDTARDTAHETTVAEYHSKDTAIDTVIDHSEDHIKDANDTKHQNTNTKKTNTKDSNTNKKDILIKRTDIYNQLQDILLENYFNTKKEMISKLELIDI